MRDGGGDGDARGRPAAEDDVIENHNTRGRVIDLEVEKTPTGRPGFGTTIRYWTVNLTNQ